MPKPFKIEDSPLFQITLPETRFDETPEKQTKKSRRKIKTTVKKSTTESSTTTSKTPLQQEQNLTEPRALPPQLYQFLLDKLVKQQTPTEYLVFSTLLKFSKITYDPTSPNGNLIITEPISINKISQLCNIAFKTAKRAIRNLINKKHISILSPYNSQTHKPTEYTFRINNIITEIYRSDFKITSNIVISLFRLFT